MQRRFRIKRATPRWANIKKIREFYANRPNGYHVDHILPISGKNVSGLNVIWNLQYLLASENYRKRNKFTVSTMGASVDDKLSPCSIFWIKKGKGIYIANRYYTQFRYSLEKAVVDLFGLVTFGAAGAPTLNATKSKGIKSITRTGAGAYDIVFGVGSNQDVYVDLLFAGAVFLAANPASPVMHVVSQTVATPTTGKISVQFRDYAGAATDPGNGELGYLKFQLKNSTAQ